jgi:hypothetical protein
MSALVDVLAGLAQERPVTIRDAVTTATAGSVMVGGAQVAVSRWVNRPEGAGQRVVLLLQGGTAVAVGAGLYRPDLDARYVRTGTGPLRANAARVTFLYDGSWHRANLTGLGLTNITAASFSPWGTADALHISVVDSNPANFGLAIWRWDGTRFTGSLQVSVSAEGT